jgi:PAS domain S-box-containing protein
LAFRPWAENHGQAGVSALSPAPVWSLGLNVNVAIAMRSVEFLDGFPAALYRSTLEGTILYCNRSFANLFGYASSRELIGSPEIALYRNKRERGYLVAQLLQEKRLVDIPIGFRKKDGSVFSCAVTVQGVVDDDGMVVHLDGLLRDMADQNRLTAPAQAAPGEKLQGVLEMAGGVVHHLNQPLTIISNLLNELMVDLPMDPSGFEKLVQIQQQMGRVIALTRMIASINSYKCMEYVAGVKIVDIEKASRPCPERPVHD